MKDHYCADVAGFDRGEVRGVDEKRYRVESSTRDGVVTRWIEAVQGEYETGDAVYFFMFDDGRGMILGRIID